MNYTNPENLETTSLPEEVKVEYGKEPFVVITENNYKTAIPAFCKAIFKFFLTENPVLDSEINYRIVASLESILNHLPRPFTVVQEFYHIDSAFRDTYYTYFSNQHFQITRHSRRLSFFLCEINANRFFSNDIEDQEVISDSFVGSCVINPLYAGALGRTLISPLYFLGNSNSPVYVRLSLYTLHIYGKKFSVRAFPYRMQDGRTMRCTEVTLLNLLEYYANSYPDYRQTLPSDILTNEQKHSYERVLPSRGISYPTLTKLLFESGFFPRLYNLSSITEFSLSNVTRDEQLRRIMHYYVESGIPVAVNLLPVFGDGSGHSIICIGHGCSKPVLIQRAKKNKVVSFKHKDFCHPIIDSADFFEDYVIIDDNQPVYQTKNFYSLSLYPDMRVEDIAVPLHRRMFLDATDAASIVKSILHHKHYGIDAWTEGFLKPQEDVIIRLFLTSSYSLKEFRINAMSDPLAKEAYSIIPMPHFVWVCELYRMEDYKTLKAFGEVVLDATFVSDGGANYQGIILMRYPKVIVLRYPEDMSSFFPDTLEIADNDLFPGFRGNLEEFS